MLAAYVHYTDIMYCWSNATSIPNAISGVVNNSIKDKNNIDDVQNSDKGNHERTNNVEHTNHNNTVVIVDHVEAEDGRAKE